MTKLKKSLESLREMFVVIFHFIGTQISLIGDFQFSFFRSTFSRRRWLNVLKFSRENAEENLRKQMFHLVAVLCTSSTRHHFTHLVVVKRIF